MFTEIVLHDYARPLRQRLERRKHSGPYRWSPGNPTTGRGFYSSSRDALIMDKARSSLDLRLERANNYLRGTWFANVDEYWCGGDEWMTPIIARLPAGRGFVPGWTMGAGMCGVLGGDHGPDVWETAKDAAWAAHYMAEVDALAEQEHRIISDSDLASFDLMAVGDCQ